MIYDEQQDNKEPIEYTHFNEWFTDNEYNNAPCIFKLFEQKANEIVINWEKSLNIKLPHPNFEKEGIEGGFELIVNSLDNQGFDIYNGDEFIEIYKR